MDSISIALPRHDEEDKSRHAPHPRFRRLAFHLAGAKELDIPSELKLVARAQDLSRPQASETALKTLVACHMDFLTGIARKVALKSNMPHIEEDLISEAITSFVKTIMRYRGEAHGARLSTYATYVVSGDLMTFALRNCKIYAMGTSSQDRTMIFGYDAFMNAFQREEHVDFDLDNPDHVQRLAEIANVAENVVRRVCQQKISDEVIDVETIDVEDLRPGANPAAAFEAASTRQALLQTVEDIRANLNARDRHILDTLLEYDGEDSTVRSRLGKKHGITSERVGQIYRNATAKIRKRLKNTGLTASLL
jgi:RNA polymerase sigma factor (sigma-70 family)